MTEPVRRRALLLGAASGVTAAAVGFPATAGAATGVPRLVRELEEKIQAGMTTYGIPGVAYGLRHQGRDYVGGFGVTSVAAPEPVDGDTLFRIASTTKTFTGTALMRLIEQGRLDLDRTIRSYLPGFRTADEAASRRVTLRQALNHSAGWLGDSFVDTGAGDDALARYVAAMATLPQLTTPGQVFAYNNAAIGVAGRILEVATGRVYEDALRSLVLGPLSLRQSAFTPQDVPGARVAVPHGFDRDGNLVAVPEALAIPRSLHSFGGLFSSARDQLRWARYHLGAGAPLLTRRSLRAMRWRPGPAGMLVVEVDGAGVTWMLRPSAEGPRIVQHGGNLGGQHSGFLFVPERDFALTVLTNSEGGPQLLSELFADDWALSRFAGLHNLPARPRVLSAAELAPYQGRYVGQQVGVDGVLVELELELIAAGGRLSVRAGGQEALVLPFFRRDRVLAWATDGADTYSRGDFVRDPDGTVGWFRFGGRLYRRNPLGTAAALLGTATALRSVPATIVPGTLPYPPVTTPG